MNSAASNRTAARRFWWSACELVSIATASIFTGAPSTFAAASPSRSSRSQRATSVGPGVVSPSVPGITLPSRSTAPSVPMLAAGARCPSRWRRMAALVVFPFVPVMPTRVISSHGSA